MEKKEKTVFEVLSEVNVNEFVEKKNNMSYLSWTYAWANTVKRFPDANYEIIKDEKGLPYFADENGAIVYTKVTIDNITREMWLPVMDGANKAMKAKDYSYKTKYGEKHVNAYTMFDINKTIMRCLVKNIAMFGLGINVYAGDDLPLELEKEEVIVEKATADQVKKINKLFKDKKISQAQINKQLATGYKVKKVEELSATQAEVIIKKLESK